MLTLNGERRITPEWNSAAKRPAMYASVGEHLATHGYLAPSAKSDIGEGHHDDESTITCCGGSRCFVVRCGRGARHNGEGDRLGDRLGVRVYQGARQTDWPRLRECVCEKRFAAGDPAG